MSSDFAKFHQIFKKLHLDVFMGSDIKIMNEVLLDGLKSN
jgi:hypothetical protein